MLSGAKNANVYVDWLAYIRRPETRDAFRYFIGLAAGLSSLTCYPQAKGAVFAFRFYIGKDQPFAFIVNRSSLLFYFRAPAVRSGKYSFDRLNDAFDSAAEPRSEEWTVRLQTVADVQRLWKLVDVQ